MKNMSIEKNEFPIGKKTKKRTNGMGMPKDHVREFEDDDRHMIRYWNKRQDFDENFPDENVTAGELVKEAETMRLMFGELEDRYGIRVPHFESFIAEHDTKHQRYKNKPIKTLFSLADKVNGQKLHLVDIGRLDERERTRFRQELKTLFSSLVKYFADKTGNNEAYLRDVFRPEQYVYGRTEKDSGNGMYLVDIEPRTQKYPAEDEIAEIGNQFVRLCRLMAEYGVEYKGDDFEKLLKALESGFGGEEYFKIFKKHSFDYFLKKDKAA